MNNKSKQKDISIEVLRVIACFLVIMAHIQLKPVISDGDFCWKRIWFSAIIGDNVPIFFLITGFYMFRGIESNDDIFRCFKIKVKKFLINIYVPSLIIVVLTCILETWINKSGDILSSIQWDTLQKFIFGVSASGSSGHLWYVSTYIRFIVFFPFLGFICQNRLLNNRVRRIYILIGLLNVLLSDLEYLIQRDIVDFSKISFDNYFLYLLLGNELYIFLGNRKKDKNNILIGISLYFVGIILKFLFQYYAFVTLGTSIKSWYMGLECLPCYLSSMGIFIFVYSWGNVYRVLGKLWTFLGKYSFWIYLCHLIILKKLQSLQVQAYFISINKDGKDFINIFMYYLEFGVIVFILSLIIGVLFEKIYKCILNIFIIFRRKLNNVK